MAEKITKTDLPVDPKERRAALNAMLKPLVDRAVAACAEARQAVLRSDEVVCQARERADGGGYWLEPLEDAANHWAVESRAASASRSCGRGGRTRGGGEQSGSPSATSLGVRRISRRTSTPSLRRSRLWSAKATLHPSGCGPPGARNDRKKRIFVRAVVSDPERHDVQGEGMWERDAGRLSCGDA